MDVEFQINIIPKLGWSSYSEINMTVLKLALNATCYYGEVLLVCK